MELIIVGILAGLGIVGTTAWAIVKVVFRADERMVQATRTSALDTDAVKALRDEIAALRETSTQFDLSIEHIVQRLEERLARIEQRTFRAGPATGEHDSPQIVGRRD